MARLSEVDPIGAKEEPAVPHLSFLGSIEKYRQIFLNANDACAPSHVGPSEPPMVYDPSQGGMVAPGQRGELITRLRQLFDKTADAHDGDYAEKVSHALIAVYAYGRRQTTPSTTRQSDLSPFQGRVAPFMEHCFGPEISADTTERYHRFIEESLELAQALGCSAQDAHMLVDYTFNRPVGQPHQETGGVMVTLAALCLAAGLDMHAAGEDELRRVWGMIDVIREKQKKKPKGSPLPQYAERTTPSATLQKPDAKEEPA